jgi:hypothetical protein
MQIYGFSFTGSAADSPDKSVEWVPMLDCQPTATSSHKNGGSGRRKPKGGNER